MKAYKAYEVDGDCPTIVFAESAGAAKRIAQTTDACEGCGHDRSCATRGCNIILTAVELLGGDVSKLDTGSQATNLLAQSRSGGEQDEQERTSTLPSYCKG